MKLWCDVQLQVVRKTYARTSTGRWCVDGFGGEGGEEYLVIIKRIQIINTKKSQTHKRAALALLPVEMFCGGI